MVNGDPVGRLDVGGETLGRPVERSLSHQASGLRHRAIVEWRHRWRWRHGFGGGLWRCGVGEAGGAVAATEGDTLGAGVGTAAPRATARRRSGEGTGVARGVGTTGRGGGGEAWATGATCTWLR